MPLLILMAIYLGAMGQYWAWVYLLILDTIIIAGDAFLGDDKTTPEYRYPMLLTILVYINFPVYLIFLTIAIYMSGSVSLPSFEQIIYLVTGSDIALTRHGTAVWHLAGYVFTGGLLMGSALTIPAHELVHHKKKKIDWLIGNWMMAFTCDSAFAIEHVHGHHKNVGLATDPATAKRGESFYLFFLKASLQEHRDGWKIENERLKKRGHGLISVYNRMIRGYARSFLILAIKQCFII